VKNYNKALAFKVQQLIIKKFAVAVGNAFD
jgi:hypothetical protein